MRTFTEVTGDLILLHTTGIHTQSFLSFLQTAPLCRLLMALLPFESGHHCLQQFCRSGHKIATYVHQLLFPTIFLYMKRLVVLQAFINSQSVISVVMVHLVEKEIALIFET